MRCLALISFVFLAQSLLCQLTDTWVNDDLDNQKLKLRQLKADQRFHAAIRPYAFTSIDTSEVQVLPADKYVRSVGQRMALSPIIGIEAGLQNRSNADDLDIQMLGLLGLRSRLNAHSKFKIDLDVYAGIEPQNDLKRALLDSSDVIGGIGRGVASGDALSTFGVNGMLSYSPSSIFTVQVGRSKHQFGHGYRSLLLGDGAAAYPFLKLNTKVWHLNYVNLFSWQQGVFDVLDDAAGFEDKFTSTHILSWNITDRIDAQVFESIIWQGRDEFSNRGFDINYLNPVIFFRPVEFATGSSDNAILGFGTSYRVPSGYHMYSQVVIDEFLLARLREGNGWWANKFGSQIGVKSFDSFGVKDLFVQAEFNLTRPFTYSHGSPVQNYAHLNEPLAHPLGANFYEALLIASKPIGKIEWRNQLMYQQFGRDSDEGNLGGNIFRSYVNPENQFGNFIGQGQRFEEISNTLYGSYIFDRDTDFRLQLGYRFLYQFGDIPSNSRHMVSLGLRMNFRDPYR